MKHLLLNRTALASLLLGVVIFGAAPARAQPFRYSLATQQEFGLKRGFKLGFEDNAAQLPRTLGSLRLLLSVADGKSWRFPEVKAAWQWDREYKVRAVIGTGQTEIWLDGQSIGKSQGGFAPARDLSVLKAGLDTRSFTGASEYLIQQTGLKLSASRGQSRSFDFPSPEKWALPLFALEPQTPIQAPWKMVEGEGLTIETSFRILRAPDLKALGAIVDKFGQSRHADWPGKIHGDAEFQAATADEERRHQAWGTTGNTDIYGGTKTPEWSEKPSGFFRTVRRNGFWWLVSPLGNPCFYIGVDTVLGSFEKTGVSTRESLFEALPPREGEFSTAWGGGPNEAAFGFTTANLIRKHGANWEDAAWQQAARRIRAWGFSGVGKWSGIPTQVQIPTQPVLRRAGVPTLGRLPDIFDGSVRDALRATLEKSIAPHKSNPFVLGWSFGNEHDEIVLKSDIQNILKQPAAVPAKRALVAHALQRIYAGDTAKMAAAWKVEKVEAADADAAMRTSLEASVGQPSDADIETLRRHFADEYYGFVYRTVKEIDPNHLYFGSWILPGWWENEEDWKLLARHCDVIGYDSYGFPFADERLERLLREADKPALCGEFSFPSWYGGQRGYGAFGAATASDEESGQFYAQWIAQAASNPYCVGAHWFQYRDQPLTGRGTKGTALTLDEHYAFGLVDIADRPKWDMIAPMRAANLQAAALRLKAAQDAAAGARK